MAEEVVVKEALTKEMIEAGAELLRHLDQSNLGISAALWLYNSEFNRWRLVIASPEVKTHGSLKVYKKIYALLAKMPKVHAVIEWHVSAMEDHGPLLSSLRKIARRGIDLSGKRFSQAVDGYYIEDAYIYRVT
jgi:hypothetical protein